MSFQPLTHHDWFFSNSQIFSLLKLVFKWWIRDALRHNYPSYAQVLILDANGGEAPKLAKALATQGFGKVFVIEGGFNGWQSAGLGVKSAG